MKFKKNKSVCDKCIYHHGNMRSDGKQYTDVDSLVEFSRRNVKDGERRYWDEVNGLCNSVESPILFCQMCEFEFEHIVLSYDIEG